jgi:hypothetical protein
MLMGVSSIKIAFLLLHSTTGLRSKFMGNPMRETVAIKMSIFLWLWLLVSTGPLLAAQETETMTPARFQEIVSTPCDTVPLASELASVPFWTNAVVSNVMTYASGKVVREEMTQTACTVAGKYIVFSVQSRFYNRTMHAIATYDVKAAALKLYGFYSDEHGRDVVTEATIVYDYTKKTYTITSSYGAFRETTTGSYTGTEDTAKTVVYKDGELFMTREVKTRQLL